MFSKFSKLRVVPIPYSRVLKRPFSNGLKEQVTAVLGAQWGDEGKGKLVDILASKYDVCARFNGGSNAGHTIVADGKKFAMHLLPCGVLHNHVINVIGNGTVVHVPTLLNELQSLLNADVKIEGRLKISDRAHITFDFHQIIDGALETMRDSKGKDVKKGEGSIGTTRRGIGPTYASKMYRNGLRFGDLKNWDSFKEKYLSLIETSQNQFNFEYNSKEELKRFENYRSLLLPTIENTIHYVNNALKDGKRILVEGANAALLDIDFGTYPMVTASNTTIGGIATGLGLSSRHLGSVIGVVKAYTTRVGHGPFPCELEDSIGDHLVKVGHEFGTTTGRRRRTGWLDIPIIQYSHTLNSYDSINITKLDVLDGLDEILIGKAYILNGKRLPYGYMPSTLDELSSVQVEYESLKGWKTKISDCRSYRDLPDNARKYIERIEELVGVRVSWVGVGNSRDAMCGKGFTWQNNGM